MVEIPHYLSVPNFAFDAMLKRRMLNSSWLVILRKKKPVKKWCGVTYAIVHIDLQKQIINISLILMKMKILLVLFILM